MRPDIDTGERTWAGTSGWIYRSLGNLGGNVASYYFQDLMGEYFCRTVLWILSRDKSSKKTQTLHGNFSVSCVTATKHNAVQFNGVCGSMNKRVLNRWQLGT